MLSTSEIRKKIDSDRYLTKLLSLVKVLWYVEDDDDIDFVVPGGDEPDGDEGDYEDLLGNITDIKNVGNDTPMPQKQIPKSPFKDWKLKADERYALRQANIDRLWRKINSNERRVAKPVEQEEEQEEE